MNKTRDAQNNRIIRGLIGPIMSNYALFSLVVFFILVEFIVAPIFDIYDQLITYLIDLFGIEKHPVIRRIIELAYTFLAIFLIWKFLKSRLKKSGDTLRVSVDQQVALQSSDFIKMPDVTLIFALSDIKRFGNNTLSEKPLWEAEFDKLPNLNDSNFNKKWNQSDYAKHSWRQPFLCINHFIEKDIKLNVYVLCSKESSKQYADFKHIISKLDAGNALVVQPIANLFEAPQEKALVNNGVDFNNIKSVTNCLDKAVRKLESDDKNSRIYLDVTSGTKIVSAASAMVSFAQERRFVYVTADGDVDEWLAQYDDDTV